MPPESEMGSFLEEASSSMSQPLQFDVGSPLQISFSALETGTRPKYSVPSSGIPQLGGYKPADNLPNADKGDTPPVTGQLGDWSVVVDWCRENVQHDDE